MKLMQWIVLDLKIFREQWVNNRPALKYEIRDNGDGTQFHSFEVDSFPTAVIIGVSENLKLLLDPLLGVPYIDRPPTKPPDTEVQRRLRRDRALREWHTNPSIKMPFEEYWAQLEEKRTRGNAA